MSVHHSTPIADQRNEQAHQRMLLLEEAFAHLLVLGDRCVRHAEMAEAQGAGVVANVYQVSAAVHRQLATDLTEMLTEEGGTIPDPNEQPLPEAVGFASEPADTHVAALVSADLFDVGRQIGWLRGLQRAQVGWSEDEAALLEHMETALHREADALRETRPWS